MKTESNLQHNNELDDIEPQENAEPPWDITLSRRSFIAGAALGAAETARKRTAASENEHEPTLANIYTAWGMTGLFFGELGNAVRPQVGGLKPAAVARLVGMESARLGILTAAGDTHALHTDLHLIRENLALIPIIAASAEIAAQGVSVNPRVLIDIGKGTYHTLVAPAMEDRNLTPSEQLTAAVSRVAGINGVFGFVPNGTYATASIANSSQRQVAELVFGLQLDKQPPTVEDLRARQNAVKATDRRMNGWLGFDKLSLSVAANRIGMQLADPPYIPWLLKHAMSGQFARDPLLLAEGIGLGIILGQAHSFVETGAWLAYAGAINSIDELGEYTSQYVRNHLYATKGLWKTVTDPELRDLSLNGAVRLTQHIQASIQATDQLMTNDPDNKDHLNEIKTNLTDLLAQVPQIGLQIDLRTLVEQKIQFWEQMQSEGDHPLIRGFNLKALEKMAAPIIQLFGGTDHQDSHSRLGIFQEEHITKDELNTYFEAFRHKHDASTSSTNLWEKELTLAGRQHRRDEVTNQLLNITQTDQPDQWIEDLLGTPLNDTNQSNSHISFSDWEDVYQQLTTISHPELRQAVSSAVSIGSNLRHRNEHDTPDHRQLLHHATNESAVVVSGQMCVIPALVVSGTSFLRNQIGDPHQATPDDVKQMARTGGVITRITTSVGDNIVASESGRETNHQMFTEIYGAERYNSEELKPLQRAASVAPLQIAMENGPFTQYGNMPAIQIDQVHVTLDADHEPQYEVRRLEFQDSLPNLFAWGGSVVGGVIIDGYMTGRIPEDDTASHAQVEEVVSSKYSRRDLLRKFFPDENTVAIMR